MGFRAFGFDTVACGPVQVLRHGSRTGAGAVGWVVVRWLGCGQHADMGCDVAHECVRMVDMGCGWVGCCGIRGRLLAVGGGLEGGVRG